MANQPTNRKTLKTIRFIFIALVASGCLLAGCKGKFGFALARVCGPLNLRAWNW